MANTTFTQDIGDLICALIAEGQSLRKICSLEGYPVLSTVMLWVAKGTRGEEPYKDFSEQYARALDIRTEYWAEELIDIADDVDADYLFTDDGKRIFNSENVQRARVRIDSRKWLMGKLKPKKYGEKVTQELIGDKDKPLSFDGKIEIIHVKPKS